MKIVSEEEVVVHGAWAAHVDVAGGGDGISRC